MPHFTIPGLHSRFPGVTTFDPMQSATSRFPPSNRFCSHYLVQKLCISEAFQPNGLGDATPRQSRLNSGHVCLDWVVEDTIGAAQALSVNSFKGVSWQLKESLTRGSEGSVHFSLMLSRENLLSMCVGGPGCWHQITI